MPDRSAQAHKRARTRQGRFAREEDVAGTYTSADICALGAIIADLIEQREELVREVVRLRGVLGRRLRNP